MRLFIAVNFSDDIKSSIIKIQNIIKAKSLKGSFSRPENLHLTMAFLGETSSKQVPLVCSVMEKASAQCGPFSLDFTRTGFFKHGNKELWWIGADLGGSENVFRLRRLLEEGLYEAGIYFDERPFNAHITLGREIKHSSPIEIPEIKISVPVDRICLMKSEHINGSLLYTEIAHSVLTKY
jgi:2'-5' RNA ligase